MFFKKCTIPAQLVRHTALQLLLSSYKFMPTLTQWPVSQLPFSASGLHLLAADQWSRTYIGRLV